MKIQTLAIIFILIILPISIVLSEYIQAQITTLNLETSYDSRLLGATYDAVRAFQLNAVNSSTNDLASSKIRDIEASANLFLTSISNNFGESGLEKEGVQSFIPAIVYCLYDGYYIYSPYKNNLSGKDEHGNENGIDVQINEAIETNEHYGQTGDFQYIPSYKPKYKGGEDLVGLKPYIYYSCRYKKDANNDFVITYSLDNYIQIQGIVNGESWFKSGYMLDGVTYADDNYVVYNGTRINNDKETLTEFVYDPGTNQVEEYQYAKINGTKYYLDSNDNENIFYMLNEKKMIQVENPNDDSDEAQKNTYNYYHDTITQNNTGYLFYKKAYDFTQMIRNTPGIKDVTYGDAVNSEGNHITDISAFTGNKKIFDNSATVVEAESSNFTEHRIAVIRYTIQTNLTTAIANYNNNFASGKAAFEMPKLSETDWYKIINNVSMITFLQGLPIGGKIYNGYAVVTNNKNEDYVANESICITTDGQFHRFDDTDLQGASGMIGYLNLDFERHTSDEYHYYYPRPETGCYTSIVNQTSLASYDDIYNYFAQNNIQNKPLAVAYYTALGREKYSMYRYFQLDDYNLDGTVKEE